MKNFISQNKWYLFILIFITVTVYANILDNEFAVVDDLSSFINYQPIRHLPEIIKTLSLQKIIYALSYHYFGINPAPLHVFSLVLHVVNALLVFGTLYKLFNPILARIAALLFAVHPVNTEAVTWISGSSHLYNTLFGLLTILSYVLYKKTRRKKFLIISYAIYGLALILIPNAWLLVTPLALFVIDQFILGSQIKWKSGIYLCCFLAMFGLMYLFYLNTRFADRISTRDDSGHVLSNQQTLTPFWESSPFTIYSMAKLYSFPKDLTIYYDGLAITRPFYITMFIFSALYFFAIFYFWRKQRQIAGLLILLVVLIIPTLSPKKITWFIAERYLYFGSGFFAALLAMAILKIERIFVKTPYFLFIATGILLAIFSFRTIARNNDWQNPKTLALATIKVSPQSVRPYNDLAGAYGLDGNWPKATEYYQQALAIAPSATAVSNLGYIYLLTGLPALSEGLNPQSINLVEEKKMLEAGIKANQAGQTRATLYYLNRALMSNPASETALMGAAQIYQQEQQPTFARQLWIRVLEVNPHNQEATRNLKTFSP